MISDTRYFVTVGAVVLVVIVLLFIAGRSSDSAPRSALPWLAGILIVAGIAGTVYFYFFFFTSLAIDQQTGELISVRNVQNIGLLSDRQNGINISLTAFLSGIILAAARTLKKYG